MKNGFSFGTREHACSRHIILGGPAVKGTRWNRIGLRLQFLYNNSLTKKYIMDQFGN